MLHSRTGCNACADAPGGRSVGSGRLDGAEATRSAAQDATAAHDEERSSIEPSDAAGRRRRSDTLRADPIMFTLRWIRAQSAPTRALLILTLTVVTVILDWVSGPETSMLLLYSLTVAVAAWSFGRASGLATSLLASIGTALTILYAPSNDVGTRIVVLNAGFRFLTLALLATVISALQARIDAAEFSADRDGMTALLNRSAILEQLDVAVRRSERRDEQLGVLYFDLDGLKLVNDQHGHAAGDELIRRFAHCLRRNVRTSDILGRVGGDEFVLICPDLDDDSMSGLLARLSNDADLPSTSVGVAYHRPGMDSAALLTAADASMYRSKLAHRAALAVHDLHGY